jgi:catechol 2,3-dioxygenase-like lactoylglutathione lyase family enzyme
MFDRRQFLGSAAATTAFFAIHDLPLIGAQAAATAQDEPKRPRILSLELLAGAPLSAMKAFYGKTLDLRLFNERPDRFTVEAGESTITFVTSQDAVGGRAPFYHFAFNIPENKILKALEWQKARTPMLAIPERNRAEGFPPEVVDYRHWNAHSVFFLDPAGNVVEYIARHDLKNGDPNAFSWADILYVSEIALVVDDVTAAADALKGMAGVTPYKAADGNFTAMGDEYGLLLVMKRGRVIDFTGNADSGVRVYRTGVNLRGSKAAQHQLASYPYHLTIEERCACG